MSWLEPVSLTHSEVCLVPLSRSHHDGLVEAVRDGRLWEHWYTHVPAPEQMAQAIEHRLEFQAQGTWLPFAVLDPGTGSAVGMTNFMNADARNCRLEIGGTWYRRSVQRTALNTACKLILLRYAFETLGCIAVEFRTHFFNHQSRRAIERLGAKLDGVLRSHQRADNGTLRDTCVYSIVQSEWPTVEAHLEYRLHRGRDD